MFFLHKENKLLNKYGDEEVVEKIIKGLVWQGQTEEQLIDSVGRPTFVVHDYNESSVNVIWRYEHSRPKTGRYRSWGVPSPNFDVFIDNGKVVSWEITNK